MWPTVFWSVYLIIPANVPPVLEIFLGLLTSIFISSMELSSGQKHLTFLSKQNLHAQFSQWTSLHLSYTDMTFIQLICVSSRSWTAFRKIKIISWPCPWVWFSSYCASNFWLQPPLGHSKHMHGSWSEDVSLFLVSCSLWCSVTEFRSVHCQLTTWLNVSHCDLSKSLTFYIIAFLLPCYFYFNIIISPFSLPEA